MTIFRICSILLTFVVNPESGMKLETDRTSNSSPKTDSRNTPRNGSLKRVSANLRDEQAWTRQSLENLSNEIDRELEKREKNAALAAEKAKEKIAKPVDNVSFEEALRREVAQFQKQHRSGVMSGR